MAKIRQQKVAAQIQKIVAMTLIKEIADPRIDGLISVTRVDVTPDLREAKVHLSIIANKRPSATILEGINSAGRHIQSEVAKGLTMRFVPRLSFHLDESLKKEAEILKTIAEANRKE